MTRLVEGGAGSAYSRQAGDKQYWYWQPPTGKDGTRPSAFYLGRDTPEVRDRIAAMAGPRAPAMRERRDMVRSEEHTSELQSLMRISYAVFCLKKKTEHRTSTHKT